MASRRRLIISYQSTPDLSVWQRIQPDFVAQLPLRNLHWKTATRSLRTIQSLEIDLRAFQTLPAEQAQQIPPSLLERPYLHLLFVACDDNDLYRQTLRQQIRDWLDSVSTRRNQEWLIIHVATHKAGPSKFYQRKSAVVDKIKADFNTGKRDRVAQLTLGGLGSAEDPVLWAELISKIKESVITTFDANVVSFEEDVRKIDSQRSLPGWNFCMFFIQKEGLALSFEAMNLLEDALIQYDELEASFFHSLRENTLVWFGKLGGTAQGDDSLDIFSANAKPYRDLIKSNAISLFDFRMYLFARQGSLLGRLGRTLEVARRGMAFIGNIGYSLRQQQSSLDPDFVAAWTYSAATQIVSHCDQSFQAASANGAGSESHYAIRAELLDLASKQLEKIGVTHELLPAVEPFSSSLDEEQVPPGSPVLATTRRPTKTPITQPEVKGALADPAYFSELYGSLLSHAHEDYAASYRHRAASRLSARIAAHDRLQKQNALALKRLASLPDRYSSPSWPHLEAELLATLGQLQADAEDPKEQLLTTLSLLRAGTSLGPSKWQLDIVGPGQQQKELAYRLIEDVRSLSNALEKNFAAIAFPTFQIRVASEIGRREHDAEAAMVDVTLANHLPCTVAVDDVRLKVTTEEGDHVWFSTGPSQLSPGSNSLSCRSAHDIVGTCHLETSQIYINKVVFQYAHRVPTRELAPSIKRLPTDPGQSTVVHFALDPFAVHMQLIEPDVVVIGQQRTFRVRIVAGRTDLAEAMLSITATNNAVELDIAHASISSGSKVALEAGKQSIRFSELARWQALEIEVPITTRSGVMATVVHLDLHYSSAAGRPPNRKAHAELPLTLALPLAVGVQDHFRQSRAFSCYNISSAADTALRIHSARLTGSRATASRSSATEDIVVLPGQPANFTFAFDAPSSPQDEMSEMALEVAYRCLDDEIMHALRGALLGAAKEIQLHSLLDDLAKALLPYAVGLRHYALFGHLSLGDFAEREWRKKLEALFGQLDLVDSIVDILKTVFELDRLPVDLADMPWKSLQIPVERPSMPLVCQASVELLPQQARLTAGEPASATVKLQPFTTWSSQPQKPATVHKLAYEVVAEAGDWVVAGIQKGQMEAKENETHAFELTLVPLRSGRLPVPRVAFSSISNDADARAPPAIETYQANAAQAVDVMPSQVRSSSTFVIDL